MVDSTELFKAITIEDSSVVPKYVQLQTGLKKAILDYELPRDTRLPSENEVLAHFKNISYTTAIKAFNNLVNEGVVYRVRGKGTFVAEVHRLSVRSSADKKKRNVGLVTPFNFAGDILFGEMFVGLEAMLQENGYNLIICNSHNTVNQEVRCLERLLDAEAAGIVLFMSEETELHSDATRTSLAHLKAQRYPFVLVDRYLPEMEANFVGTDNVSGGYKAGKYLVDSGCREIVYLNCSDWEFRTALVDRYQGFRKALFDQDIPMDKCLMSTVDRNTGGYSEAIEKIKEAASGKKIGLFTPECLVTMNTIGAFHRKGQIPENICFIGFDEYRFGEHFNFNLPQITSIAQPMIQIGVQAARLLVSLIEHPQSELQRVLIPPRLSTSDVGRAIPDLKGLMGQFAKQT
jgi:DNA-binding LacI/PurR family transcriptional regulator